MADQISTPGSNADSSLNIGKSSAPKDKACPFCQQQFTSSSLGRHLDLYIKEKNPKPVDGVHNVDEIRKLRGGITRRQPRNSTNKREGSTPVPTANGERNGKTTPPSEVGTRNIPGNDLRSPIRREQPMDLNAGSKKGQVRSMWHKASWEATGVINDIPPITPNGHSEKWDQEADDGRVDRRTVDGRRTVSRQMLAKSAFDQKKKMTEAVDNARAAELALREIVGSIRAANRRVKPSVTPFDYDPLSLDFPALTLHCLPPPPTLNQVTPIASPTSWSITPPEKQQLEALRSHFRDAFHAWHISRAVASSAHPDELLTYNSDLAHSSSEEAEVHAAARELEERVTNHLHATFAHWSTLPLPLKAEVWRMELAKAVGYKDHTISALKSDREKILQENAHLRAQVEQLSRCQQPREFQIMPPATISISSRVAVELCDMGVRGEGLGLSINDKDETIDGLVKTAVGRWLAVVQTGRTNSGMASQRSLESAENNRRQPPPPPPLQQQQQQQQTIRQIQNKAFNQGQDDQEMSMDLDADADADADAEGEENFDIPTSGSMPAQGCAPEAPMGMVSAGYGNHNRTNGNTAMDREGINGQYCGNRVLL